MSALITENNLNDLQTIAIYTLTQTNEWFTENGLTFKLDKTNVIHFKSNYLQDGTFQITCQAKEVKEAIHTKFYKLGLDNHMKWKTHVHLLLPKLCRACYFI
jgi:hypothetical protein